jgi:hypothetical protein
LEAVEALLRKAVTAVIDEDTNSGSSSSSGSASNEELASDLLKERLAQKQAKENLCLYLLQEGHFSASCKFLRSLGYTWRLGRGVFNYPLPPPNVPLVIPTSAETTETTETTVSAAVVRAYDQCLSSESLQYLQHMFRETSPYWSAHSYDLSSNSGKEVGKSVSVSVSVSIQKNPSLLLH